VDGDRKHLKAGRRNKKSIAAKTGTAASKESVKTKPGNKNLLNNRKKKNK
jgi:hypothetical protein